MEINTKKLNDNQLCTVLAKETCDILNSFVKMKNRSFVSHDPKPKFEDIHNFITDKKVKRIFLVLFL